MPFGFGKKKKAEPEQVNEAPAPNPQQQPPPQYNNAQQPGVYQQEPPQYGQPPPPGHGGHGQYNEQPQYAQQPQYSQQQQQYAPQQQQQQYAPQQQQYSPQQAPPPPLQATPTAGQPQEGKVTQQVGGQPVTGTPVYGDDVTCDPVVKRKFVNQGCKDCWAAGVFLLVLFITICVAGYNLGYNDVAILDWGSEKETTTTNTTNDTVTFKRINETTNESTTKREYDTQDAKQETTTTTTNSQGKSLMFFFLAFFLSILLAVIMMIVMRLHPKRYIFVANICCIVLYIVIAIWVVVCCRLWFWGIIFLLFAAFHAWWFYHARRLIPVSALLLKQALVTTHKNFGTYIASFLSMVVFVLYMAIFSAMAIPVVREASADDGPHVGWVCLCLVLILVWFWSVQVMFNVVHVIASGSVATWFFAGDANMPPAPSLASAKRALTTSFGSICFGSLLVAILQTIQVLLRYVMARAGCGLFACIAACIVGCIESLLRYFNTYAFSYLAIYGMGYVDAAKSTWDLIKTSLWAGLMNDCLTGPVLFITSLLNSIVIGLIFWVASGSFNIGFVCLLVSFVVHELIFRVAAAGITTMFICVTEDEPVLVQSNPLFYAALMQARNEIQAGTATGTV